MKFRGPSRRGLGAGRPPHGGRGLKFLFGVEKAQILRSPPARGAWIEICKKN